jgi:hypothetical protein
VAGTDLLCKPGDHQEKKTTSTKYGGKMINSVMWTHWIRQGLESSIPEDFRGVYLIGTAGSYLFAGKGLIASRLVAHFEESRFIDIHVPLCYCYFIELNQRFRGGYESFLISKLQPIFNLITPKVPPIPVNFPQPPTRKDCF